MTEINATELAQQISDRLAAAMTAANAPANPMPVAQSMTPALIPAGQLGMAAAPAPTGVSFRLSVPLPDGSEVPAYLNFGPEACQNPQVVSQVAAAVAMAWPVRAYPPRQQGYQGGGGWGGYGNRYGRRGGGRY